MKKRLSNFLKYNKVAYAVYHGLFSFLINLLRLFVVTDEKLILFNSYAGRKYDDSPKEIFLAMKDDSRFKGYRFVWALHEPGEYEILGAEKIKTDNLRYFITALKARVWVTNSSVERGLSFRGKHTLYFNTWHGSPIKRMGSDINVGNDSFGSRKGKRSTYDVFCSQGDYETDIFSSCFNIPKEKILNSGYPRNDILLNYTEEFRTTIREKLGIKPDKKVILYCPTFREYEKDENLGIVLAPPMNLKRWEGDLSKEFVLLFRAHYEVTKVMKIEDDDFVRDMTFYPDLNELMIAADVLVSDYSSIFFDYSVMGKPMLHFCYDYDKYALKRGMYFDVREWIDGADNEDVLIEKLKETKMEKSEKTKKFRHAFINYFGTATKQCVDCIARKINVI